LLAFASFGCNVDAAGVSRRSVIAKVFKTPTAVRVALRYVVDTCAFAKGAVAVFCAAGAGSANGLKFKFAALAIALTRVLAETEEYRSGGQSVAVNAMVKTSWVVLAL
jgi:hypothetical protein